MAIAKPLLPAKRGYVEVEVCGLRMYKNIETGELLPDGPVEAVPSDQEEAEDTAALLADHEYRLTLLELGIAEGGEM